MKNRVLFQKEWRGAQLKRYAPLFGRVPKATYLLVLTVIFPLAGCETNTWTEGYSSPGFKQPHTTVVNFDNGGMVMFAANASSTDFKNMQGELTLVIDLDGDVCSEVNIAQPKEELLFSTSCSFEITPGPHKINVRVYGPGFNSDITDEFDYEHNSIHGVLTMTMYQSPEIA